MTSEHEGGEEEIDLEGQNSERTEGVKVATWSALVEYKSEEEVRDTMREGEHKGDLMSVVRNRSEEVAGDSKREVVGGEQYTEPGP